MHKTTISIDPVTIDTYNKYLDSGEAFPDSKRCETIETFTAKFDDGREADIKVCSADDCSLFVDAVLFEKNGAEIAVCEPEYALDGEFEFETDGEAYVVEIVRAKAA